MIGRIMISVVLFGSLTACPWVPMDENPNRIRSPERLAYEACRQRNAGVEDKCQREHHALLMRQELEILSSDN